MRLNSSPRMRVKYPRDGSGEIIGQSRGQLCETSVSDNARTKCTRSTVTGTAKFALRDTPTCRGRGNVPSPDG